MHTVSKELVPYFKVGVTNCTTYPCNLTLGQPFSMDIIYTKHDFLSFSLSAPAFLDTNRQVVFIVHGFINNEKTTWLSPMKDEILKTEDSTVVDWRDGADVPEYPTSYNTVMKTIVWDELIGPVFCCNIPVQII